VPPHRPPPRYPTRHYAPALVAGAGAGLYASRALAEGSSAEPSVLQAAGIAVAGMLVGLGVGWWLARRDVETWPLCLLWGYVVWPVASPTTAAALLGATVVALALRHPVRTRWSWWAEATAALASLVLYMATLAPGLLPADSGEFQLVGTVLGIAHPPGYPLYTLLARAVILLPLGDPARQLNALGAVTGALTVGMVTRAVRRETGSATAALLGGGALACAGTFWAQSTTTNIRALTALFTALLLSLVLEWRRRQSGRLLAACGFTFGLAVGHHASLAFLAPILIAVLALADPILLRRPSRWLAPLGALAASGLVLLYLPLRSLMGAPFDPAPIRSAPAFLDHVLARGFGGDMLYFRSAPDVWARLGIWTQILGLQFGWAVLGAMVAAAAVLLVRRRAVALLLLGTVLANGLLAITYRAPQTVEYLMPSYVALATLLGCGWGVIQRERPGAPAIVGAIAALAVCIGWNGAANYPSFRLLADDNSTRISAEALLHQAPPDAIILANWHRATPLWYLQHVEGMRPDVEVQYVHPEGALPNEEVWLRRIAEAITERPVLVTNRFFAFDRSTYRFVPLADAWLVREEPLGEPPEAISVQEAPFGNTITLLGYRISSTEARPGETIEVRVYWRAEAPLERDYSTFVQLLGPSGVVGQGDLYHRSTEYLPGEVRVDAYRIPLLLHAAPGDYHLIAGFYYREGNGWQRLTTADADHVLLGSVTVLPAKAPFASAASREWAFEGGLFITGVDVDYGVGGQARLYVHLRGPNAEREAGASRLQARQGDTVLAEIQLPALRTGGYVVVAMDVPGDAESVWLTVLDGQGAPLRRLGPWHVPVTTGVRVGLPRDGRRYVPLGGDMVYLGCGAPDEIPGASAWLSPRFLALRPLSRDYSVSVGLVDSTGQEIKADGTPGLGALPTLKWLQGWKVTDPHRLVLRDAAFQEGARTVVTVYDAFTLEPLNVLDERLVREGQGLTVLGEEVRVP